MEQQLAHTAHVLNESHILLFLVQFLLLLGLAKLLGVLLTRLKQPTVTGDILVGVLLGPSILGRLFPGIQRALFPHDPLQYTMLDTVAWLGILFLLLVTGLEVNFSSVWKQKGKALWISLSDIIIPIIISAVVLFFLPSRYLVDPSRRVLFTLFISTIMTISAMPVSIRAMNDLKLLRTDLGFLTISALSINDVIGWVVFTIILGLFTHGTPDTQVIASLLLFTALFMVFAFTIGKHGVTRLISFIERRATDPAAYALTLICLVGLAFGAITQRIGIHALFGFFIAGLIAGESKNLSEKARASIADMVYAVFVPIFFANIGLKIDILARFDVFLVLLFTVLGIAARFIGAYVGVMLARAPRAQRWPVAALHTPGGEMHVVVATLALELRLISETVFVAIIVAAVLSSMTLGPWLYFIIRKIAPKEMVRILERFAFDIDAADKQGALQTLCSRAGQSEELDAESVFESVWSREEAMSTGLERGIAIPHARLDILNDPVVVFGRSAAGIDWNSPDGIPARLIFLILTPADEADSQIRIYQQLLRVLSEERTRRALLDAPTTEKAVSILNENLRLSFIAG